MNTPWYLKKTALYFFIIVTPPVGYTILLLNLKKFEHNQKMEYLTIGTMIMSLWLLKFLPEKLNHFVWAVILTAIVGRFLLKLLKKK